MKSNKNFIKSIILYAFIISLLNAQSQKVQFLASKVEKNGDITEASGDVLLYSPSYLIMSIKSFALIFLSRDAKNSRTGQSPFSFIKKSTSYSRILSSAAHFPISILSDKTDIVNVLFSSSGCHSRFVKASVSKSLETKSFFLLYQPIHDL